MGEKIHSPQIANNNIKCTQLVSIGIVALVYFRYLTWCTQLVSIGTVALVYFRYLTPSDTTLYHQNGCCSKLIMVIKSHFNTNQT